jgi:hypothetical protein
MSEQIQIPWEMALKSFCFAFEMANKQAHRPSRSGGSHQREKCSVLANTFQGKIAEVGYYTLSRNNQREITPVDFSVLPRGEWDNGDFTEFCNQVSVKSYKDNAQYVLLERKDWKPGRGREYLNMKENGAIVCLAVDPYHNFLEVNFDNEPHQEFDRLVPSIPNVEYRGHLTNKFLMREITQQEEQKLYRPVNTRLGNVRLDATNYSFPMWKLIKSLPPTDYGDLRVAA